MLLGRAGCDGVGDPALQFSPSLLALLVNPTFNGITIGKAMIFHSMEFDLMQLSGAGAISSPFKSVNLFNFLPE